MSTEPIVSTDESAPAAFYRLLSRGPFARYMAGETISMIGSWMQMFAQSWVLTKLTLQATNFGVLMFCAGLPSLFLAGISGSIADRFDKRRILFGVLSVQIFFACLVGWLVQSNQIAIWHLYVVNAMLGVAGAFEMPTVSAFIPELISRADLPRALAIDRAVFHFTRMIGPAVGGFLIGRLGEPTAYYLNALSFVALFIVIGSIAPRARGTAEEEEQRRGPMRAGFDFVRRDPPTRAMVLLMGAAAMFASPFFMVTMPVYAVHELGLDAQHMGALMAVSGIGSFMGAMSLLVISRGHRAIYLKCAVTCAFFGLLGLSRAPSFLPAAGSLILTTLGLSSAFGTAHIVVQERSPDAIRGRVSAVASLSFMGTIPFSALAVTWTADHIGLRNAMTCGAIVYGLAAAFLLFGRKRLATAPHSETEPVD